MCHSWQYAMPEVHAHVTRAVHTDSLPCCAAGHLTVSCGPVPATHASRGMVAVPLYIRTSGVLRTCSCLHPGCLEQVKRDHHELFKQYAPIWAKEEVERASLWTTFLLSFAPDASR